MTSLAWLVPTALFLGLLGLGAFFWALKSGQFEDLDGAAWRILEDDVPEPGEGETTEQAQDKAGREQARH